MHSSLYQTQQRILLLGLLFCIIVVPGITGTALAAPVHSLSFLTVNIDPGAAAAVKQVTVACTGGCQCLKETDAASIMGSSYEKCAAVPCEYDAAGTAKFCFHKKAQQPATTITTAVIQVPVVQYAKSAVPTTTAPAIVVQPSVISNAPAVVAASCPAGCSLMGEQAARERYGSFERCSDSPKGYDPNGSPVYCIRAVTPTGLANNTFQSSLISGAAKAAASGNASSNQSALNIGTSAVRLWSTRDALAALQVAVGKAPYSAELDLTGDGRVDSSDAREILKRSVAGTGQQHQAP